MLSLAKLLHKRLNSTSSNDAVLVVTLCTGYWDWCCDWATVLPVTRFVCLDIRDILGLSKTWWAVSKDVAVPRSQAEDVVR